MTILQAIARANAEGDCPTAQDLADGLGRDVRTVHACLAPLRRRGAILPLISLPGSVGRPLTRWVAVTEARSPIRAAERALKVLRTANAAGHYPTAHDLADLLGAPLAHARNYLRHLRASGRVIQHDRVPHDTPDGPHLRTRWKVA